MGTNLQETAPEPLAGYPANTQTYKEYLTPTGGRGGVYAYREIPIDNLLASSVMGTLGRGEGAPPMPWIEMPVYWQNCKGGIGVPVYLQNYGEGIWYLTPRGPSIRASCPGLGVGDPKCLDP